MNTKHCYEPHTFRKASLDRIIQIDDLMTTYAADGYQLTVRQCYYQMVAGGFILNNQKEYNKLANLIRDARMAGLLSWDIVDRTRTVIDRPHWDSPKQLLDACAEQFHADMWEDQPRRVICIIEKDALRGVVEATCHNYDVPLLSARGYPSVSVLRQLAVDRCDGDVLILHLGDHDPSGIDMTRNLKDSLDLFSGGRGNIELRRIALTMEQVNELNPPPNPAKQTDTRYAAYVKRYGKDCWELDALPPEYLNKLLKKHIRGELDFDSWNNAIAYIDEAKSMLKAVKL